MIIIILSLANIISSIVSIVILGFLYLQYRDRIQGINFWILAHFFLLLSLVFSISRLVIAEEIAILLTYSLQTFSFILLFIGMSRFLNKPIKLVLPLLASGFCLIGVTYFTLIENSLVSRQRFLYVFGFYLCSTIAYFLIKSRVKQLGKTVGFAAIVVFLIALTAAFGLIFALISPSTNSFLENNLKDIITISAIIVNTVLLTYAQVMLISAQLLDKVLISEREFSLVFDNSQLPILVTRLSDSKIYTVNPSFERLFGYCKKELIDKTTLDIGLWEDISQRQYMIDQMTKALRVKDLQAVLITKDRCRLICHISCNITQILGEDYILNEVYDVTESVYLLEDLKRMATHDPLTGLANRSLFYDRFDQAQALAQRHRFQLAIIMMDIDKLKEINDLYGHMIGDQALIYLTNQINQVLRKVDTFARFGGDEFCIILNEVYQLEDTLSVVARIHERLSVPLIVEDVQLLVQVSMGISIYPHDGVNVDELIKKADRAMYMVKAKRGCGYLFNHEIKNI